MKEGDFRIVENANFFTAQVCKSVVNEYSFIRFMPKYKLVWKNLTKEGGFYDVRLFNTSIAMFKTKEEAVKAIEDFKKYPIFHEYK